MLLGLSACKDFSVKVGTADWYTAQQCVVEWELGTVQISNLKI